MLSDPHDGGLAETIDALVPAAADVPVRAESILIDLPIEFHVRSDNERGMWIESTAPTQRVLTSVLPVFHRVRLELRIDEVEDEPLGRT